MLFQEKWKVTMFYIPSVMYNWQKVNPQKTNFIIQYRRP